MIDRNMHLENDHFVEHWVLHRLENIKRSDISLKINFRRDFIVFFRNNLIWNGNSKLLGNYRYDKLYRTKLIGCKVPKISQMQTNINGWLNSILIKIILKLLHIRWNLINYKRAKIKNCFLIIHFVLFLISDNFIFIIQLIKHKFIL